MTNAPFIQVIDSNYCMQVVFGGTVAYAPQTSWIKNASLRQNVLFGQEDNEEK